MKYSLVLLLLILLQSYGSTCVAQNDSAYTVIRQKSIDVIVGMEYRLTPQWFNSTQSYFRRDFSVDALPTYKFGVAYKNKRLLLETALNYAVNGYNKQNPDTAARGFFGFGGKTYEINETQARANYLESSFGVGCVFSSNRSLVSDATDNSLEVSILVGAARGWLLNTQVETDFYDYNLENDYDRQEHAKQINDSYRSSYMNYWVSQRTKAHISNKFGFSFSLNLYFLDRRISSYHNSNIISVSLGAELSYRISAR